MSSKLMNNIFMLCNALLSCHAMDYEVTEGYAGSHVHTIHHRKVYKYIWAALLMLFFNLYLFTLRYKASDKLQYIPDISPIPGYIQSTNTTLREFILTWPLKTCYQPGLSDNLASSDPNCPTKEVAKDATWQGIPFRDTFHHSLQPKCEDYDYKHLVVFVYSKVYNFKERRHIRLKVMEYLGHIIGRKVKLLFIVGRPKQLEYSKDAEEYLSTEAATFRDILRPNIEENYRQLPYKSFAAIQWLTACSKHTPFYMKMDDDLLLDMRAVYDMLPNIPCGYSHSLMCYEPIYNNVLRLPDKYIVLKSEYSPGKYPLGCIGHGYIMTRQVAGRLHDVGRQQGKVFKVDDKYFSALLRRLACISVSHLHLPNRTVDNIRFGE